MPISGMTRKHLINAAQLMYSIPMPMVVGADIDSLLSCR